MKNFLRLVILVITLAVAITCLSSPAFADINADGTPCRPGLEAFKKTMYPMLRKNCIACHENGPGPSHSVADPLASYKAILHYTNFDHLENSLIYTKGGSQHCSGYGVDCGVDYLRIKKTVAQWWSAGENQCGDENKTDNAKQSHSHITTKNQIIPLETLKENSGRFLTMTWPLDSLSAILSGLNFQINIQLFSDKNGITYRVREPRFVKSASAAAPVRSISVTGLELLLNGHIVEEANEFSKITLSGDFGSVLSTNHAIILGEKDGQDALAIRFQGLSEHRTENCKAPDAFVKSTALFLKARQCMNCHTSGSWTMATDPAELCRQTKARVDFQAIGSSTLIRYACQKFAGHPIVCQSPQEAYFYLIPWIDAERTSK